MSFILADVSNGSDKTSTNSLEFSDRTHLISFAPQKAEIQFKRVPIGSSIGFQWREDLPEIERELLSRGIDLKLSHFKGKGSPLHPKDEKVFAEFFASQTFEHKQILKKLYDNLLRLTDDDLHAALAALIKELENEIGTDTSYTMGYTPGKSSQWIAAKAMQLMHQMPSSAWLLGNDNQLSGREKTDLEPFSIGAEERVHVFFDDMSLSGTQLEVILGDILYGIKKTPEETHHVFAIVLFMSEEAKNIILKGLTALQIAERSNVVLHILTSDKILPRLLDRVSKEEWQAYCAGGFEFYAATSCQMLQNSALAYADWKVPDNRSLYSGLVNMFPSVPISVCGKEHSLFAPYVPGIKTLGGWTFIQNAIAPATYKDQI